MACDPSGKPGAGESKSRALKPAHPYNFLSRLLGVGPTHIFIIIRDPRIARGPMRVVFVVAYIVLDCLQIYEVGYFIPLIIVGLRHVAG